MKHTVKAPRVQDSLVSHNHISSAYNSVWYIYQLNKYLLHEWMHEYKQEKIVSNINSINPVNLYFIIIGIMKLAFIRIAANSKVSLSI